MRILSLLVLVFCLQTTLAQRQVIKDVDASGMQEISVLLRDIASLKVTTNTQDKVLIWATIAGEFATDIVVQLDTSVNPWQLTTDYRPGFKTVDDKLSAHKVVSIELELSIPQDRGIFVGALSGHVELNGRFNTAELLLVDGNIKLTNYFGQGVFKTKYGNIYGTFLDGMWATAKAPKGTIINQIKALGVQKIATVANRGDITLLKAKN